uniref:Uncharacterized protein n=1 Tax=Lotharella oceanica TaxID=641309 RepID=A0A7S2TGD4_9EUKA
MSKSKPTSSKNRVKDTDDKTKESRKMAMKKAWIEMFCCGGGSSEPNLSKFNWDPKEWNPEPAIAPQPRISITEVEKKIRRRWELRHGVQGYGSGPPRSLSLSSRNSSPGSVGQASIHHSARHPGKPRRDSKKRDVRLMRRQYFRDALSGISKSQPHSPDIRPLHLSVTATMAPNASRRRPSAPLNESHITITTIPVSHSAHTSRRGSYDSRDSKSSYEGKWKENKGQNGQSIGQNESGVCGENRV